MNLSNKSKRFQLTICISHSFLDIENYKLIIKVAHETCKTDVNQINPPIPLYLGSHRLNFQQLAIVSMITFISLSFTHY